MISDIALLGEHLFAIVVVALVYMFEFSGLFIIYFENYVPVGRNALEHSLRQ
jgi:hypothetical protein